MNLFVIEIYLNNQATNRKLCFLIYESPCTTDATHYILDHAWNTLLSSSYYILLILYIYIFIHYLHYIHYIPFMTLIFTLYTVVYYTYVLLIIHTIYIYIYIVSRQAGSLSGRRPRSAKLVAATINIWKWTLPTLSITYQTTRTELRFI